MEIGMKFITIDGDDIGQKIAACYFRNDSQALLELNRSVETIIKDVAHYLENQGFKIIFSAADGVAAYSESFANSNEMLYREISKIAGESLTLSVGVGDTLRESYIALMASKSNGKAQLTAYRDLA